MQRDMDLVRDLLLQIEADPQLDDMHFKNVTIDGRDANEVAYVLTMLIKAGFVNGRTAMEEPLVSGLSWKGHELLDDIRDPGIWEKTKEKAKPFATLSISILAEIAKAEIKRHLGLSG